MKMYLTMAWRNIWRNRKRTWITASSIGFAVFFACVMQSMQLGSYERMIDNSVRFFTGHLSIHQEAYWGEKILDNSYDRDQLAGLPMDPDQVMLSVPRISSFALASSGRQTKGVMVNGINPQDEAAMSGLDEKVVDGVYELEDGALIAAGLAEYLKIGVGDTLVLVSQGYHGVNAVGQYPVKGLVAFPVPELNQSAVYLSLSVAQRFYGAEGLITSYSLLLNSPGQMAAAQQSIEAALDGSELSVMNWREMMPELVQGIELDYYGGLIMIGILYMIIGFGIFGTFLMMTKERTYEFGILTAIGMKKPRVQLMVSLEIFFLTFLGVILGLMASAPIITYFYLNPIRITGDAAKAFENFGYEAIIPFSIDPMVFYYQGVVIFILALMLGIYPILYVKRLQTIKALKE
ncbi:MAG: FtsX-like permease family protein [Bacteroidota bacterium]